MGKVITKFAIIFSALLGLTAPANASLILKGQGVSLYGSFNLIYDTKFDITWYDYSSFDTQRQQMQWAANLDVNFGGTHYTDWRLPATVDQPLTGVHYDGSASFGYGDTTSEMSNLFYTELGNTAFADTSGFSPQPGWGLTNKGDFHNLFAGAYWSKTEFSFPTCVCQINNAWEFRFDLGQQDVDNINNRHLALAVRDGDVVASVPEPTSMLILGTGLIGLVGFRRRPE